ncbi:MAG TPA: glucose-6-phosphate dehydrogenase assembly protein OpcA [Acidimicrobiales bacterium]|jgi:glucose-6-phosphate dehydrogenase assembly protein OpcA|nr:glucose-6-phosphate dehydrogenase assembly protein OpcA [Acidimicrobiales bacterium]
MAMSPAFGPEVTTIGSWESDDVTVAQVEKALTELRRHEQRAAVRTSVLTLVVVVRNTAECDSARAIVHDLGTRHPSRTLVIVADDDAPDQPNGVDAALWVHAFEREGRSVCFEEVVLRVRGKARHHLDSIVDPFALPDVPMVVWLPAGLPSPGDPLMQAANRVVVDSRAVAEAGGDVLMRSATLARRLPVVDLSWMRLALWRSVLAGLFEGAVNRPFLEAVDRVEVIGNHGPRYLLGGWLLRRLQLPPARVELRSAEHVAVTIHGTSEGRRGTFSVVRPGAERIVHSCVAIEDGPKVEQTVRMREQWPALALASALTRVGHDKIYEDALAGARELRLAGGGE